MTLSSDLSQMAASSLQLPVTELPEAPLAMPEQELRPAPARAGSLSGLIARALRFSTART